MAKTYTNGKTLTHDGPCPKCREHGGDKTGNHLAFWENDKGEQWAYCNRCNYYEADKETFSSLEKREKIELTEEQAKKILDEISELPFRPLTTRAIKQATAERFGVRCGLSETDGSTVLSHYYPKTKNGILSAYKIRVLEPKFFFSQGRGRDCDFFGYEQAQKPDVIKSSLYIFEDELSAMSGFEALKEFSDAKWSHLSPACVALPDGSQSMGRVLQANRDFVESFKTIVVCMDNDEAGEQAVKVAQQLYPGKVKVVRLPLKDANDMAMAKRSRELYQLLLFSGKVESPDGAVSLASCIPRALEKPTYGLRYPWAGLTELTFGIRPEIVAVGGGVGLKLLLSPIHRNMGLEIV